MRAFIYALIVHLIIGGLLIINFDRMSSIRIKPKPQDNIITATTVDSQAVEQELQRLQDIEQEKARKQQRLEKQIQKLQDETKKAEQKRIAEQKRLAELEKKRKQEELLQKQRAEAEKRRQAELKKQRAEQALRRQLAAEQTVEQQREQRKMLGNIIANISRLVNSNFNKTGLPGGLECVLTVQTVPGGEVVSVLISKSSGNEVFDRRAVTAVEKSAPLPIPADPETHNRLNLRKFNFRFKPESAKRLE